MNRYDGSRGSIRNKEEIESKDFVTIREACSLSGLCPQTIRKLTDSHQVDCYRTPSGQRRIDKSSLLSMCNPIHDFKTIQKTTIYNFIYTRVSSKKQSNDLDRQFEYLRSKDPKYATYIPIKDIGSGINFKRKGLQTILDRCIQGTIGEIVVAHRDRLSRFGFDLIKLIVEKGGGVVTVIDDETHKSTEQELSEDLLSIVQIYCCKSMGSRRYKNSENYHENGKNKNKTKSSPTKNT